MKSYIKGSIYKIKEIINIIKPILNKYGITDIYHLGSYAKGVTKETSYINIITVIKLDE